MATQSKAQALAQQNKMAVVTPPTPAPTKCQVCGKILKRGNSVKAGIGATCAHMQATYSPQIMQAHTAKFTAPTAPKGYTVSVASLHRTITANKHKPNLAGLAVGKMVKCIGGDKAVLWLKYTQPAPKGSTPPHVPTQGLHTICKPVYVNGQRFINAWLATPQGLQAIATGNFSTAPSGQYMVAPAK